MKPGRDPLTLAARIATIETSKSAKFADRWVTLLSLIGSRENHAPRRLIE